MFDRILYWWKQIARTLLAGGLVVVLLLETTACSDSDQIEPTAKKQPTTTAAPRPQVVEVSPPETLQKLNSKLDIYRPQVTITTPTPDEVLEDTTVEVRLQVKDLPLYRDAELNLGPHLRVLLDDRPAISIYDTSQPIQFSELSPGSHTLQVLAAKPWEESFKNQDAYARTTFHVFTKTPQDIPNPDQPLLVYNTPQGSQGAEPILLDFYLDNAPLQLAAQEDANDEIEEWQIRITANGESFYFDRWQPVYLKGFSTGQNWIQVEYLNEQGEIVTNPIDNNTKLITYQPNAQDSLSQLIRGEIPLEDAYAIVDPDYTKPEETAEPEPEPEVEATPQPEETAEPEPEPKVEATPQPEETAEPEPEPEPEETFEPEEIPETEETFESEEIPETEDTFKPEEIPETEDTFESEEIPETEDTFESEEIPETEDTFEPEEIPETEDTFEPELEEDFEPELEETLEPEEIPETELEETPELETKSTEKGEETEPETEAESGLEASETKEDQKRDRSPEETSETKEANSSEQTEDSEKSQPSSVAESESETTNGQKQPETTNQDQSK
ncbi:hypothetical protein [Geitlerinema sp. PCC 9228]|uniref:hypothetical protein n=1 Tax=Geitlerinema sp. PCC 9228 TaxID=111611 RepID=UPI0008F98B03|nr:hypothetical protein [Geitlerinema sp. PCC 9228]